MIRLVTLDVNNTLLRFRVSPADEYARIAAQNGVSALPVTLKIALKHAVKQQTHESPVFGSGAVGGWQAWWRRVVDITFRQSGVACTSPQLEGIAQDLIQYYSTASAYAALPHASELLQLLEEKDVAIGVITNTDPRIKQLSEFDKSERLLHLALKLAQELEDDKVVTYIYDVLANLAFQREDYDKAEKLFKSVLQRHVEADGDVYGNVFVAVSLKLAHCFAARGDYNNAIMGFHYCIASQNQKIRPCPSDGPPTPATSTDGLPPASAPLDEDTIILWAMSVEQYAHLLLHLGRYQPAREQLQEALAVCRQVMGEMHLQTAVLRNDIGTIYSMEKRYDEAAEEIEQAISIVQSHIQAKEERAQNEPEETKPPIKVGAYPIPHADNPQGNLASYHINLGSVQLLRGRLKSARRSCEEGARVAKRGPDAEGLQEAAQCLRAVKEAVEERAARRAKNETAPIKAQA